MVTYLGSLVQLCCGEGGTLQKNITGLCGECLQCLGHTACAPPPSLLTACVLSWSILLRLQVALQGNCLKRALGCVHFPGLSCSGSGSRVLHKGTDSVGPVFCALPRSEQLRQPGAWWARSPQVAWCFLWPPPSQPLGFLGARWERHLRCALCLLWGADLRLRPSSWMSTVQDPRKTWLATGGLLSLVEDALSGAKMPPSLWLWLSPACLSASGGGWASLQPARLALLWYSLSPLFCERPGSALG